MNDETCRVDLFGPDFEERLAKVGKEDPAGLSDDALLDMIAELEGRVEGSLVSATIKTTPGESCPEAEAEALEDGRASLVVLMALVDELERRFKQAKRTGSA